MRLWPIALPFSEMTKKISPLVEIKTQSGTGEKSLRMFLLFSSYLPAICEHKFFRTLLKVYKLISLAVIMLDKSTVAL
jgi:hypothetical protein